MTILQTLNLNPEDVLWVGGIGGMEKDLVERNQIKFAAIPAAGVHGVGLRKLPRNLLKVIQGYRASRRIIKDFKPDVMLFTGGYVAFPMALAGWKIASLLYVPDVEPGLALKTLARFATRIALTTEASRVYFKQQHKLAVTGYPTRKDLTRWTKPESLKALSLSDQLPVLLVTGGSSGARTINQAMLAILPELLKNMQVIHLTGNLDWEALQAEINALPADLAANYRPMPYLHDMGIALAAADMVLSRAGASALGEYPLFGLPAILVPYPFAWRYQKVNAAYLVDHQAAILLKDEDMPDQLLQTIQNLWAEKGRLDKMKESMTALALPQAAENLAALVRELADGSIKGRVA